MVNLNSVMNYSVISYQLSVGNIVNFMKFLVFSLAVAPQNSAKPRKKDQLKKSQLS
jgi:hypothetical protein